MKHFFAPLFALTAVACCTPVQAPDASDTPKQPTQLAPESVEGTSVEDKEMAATRALRSGKNTYAQTCGPLRKKLGASRPPTAFKTRMDAGNRLENDTPPPSRLKTKHTPLPAELSDLRISAVCNIVSDLTTDGTATNIQALCSDERFKAHAEEAVSNMRWMPFTVGDKATPLPGMITKWEFCTND